MTGKYESAKANDLGSDSIDKVAKAAKDGRVDTVFLETDLIIPGKLSINGKGNIKKGNMDNPDVDDVLDDIAELVAQMGGEVVMLPKEKMPSQTGLAAIFRF